LHWFDFDRFYAEARRVLKPGGRIAVWTYSFLSVSAQLGPDIDAAVRWYYHDVVGPYWPPERRWVDDEYRTIPFPFRPLDLPSLTIDVNWRLDALLGYLASWSATQRYRDATGQDPMPSLRQRLLPLWGRADAERRLSWPLSIRFGVIE
jgi:SAM-dependent methyltransferase